MSFKPFDFPRSALCAVLSNVKELGSRFCHIFSLTALPLGGAFRTG